MQPLNIPPQCPPNFINEALNQTNVDIGVKTVTRTIIDVGGNTITMFCTNADPEQKKFPDNDIYIILASIALVLYWVYDWFQNNERNLLTLCCSRCDTCKESICCNKKKRWLRLIRIVQILPPHIWMPKLWFYIAFTLAWSHYVFNNWSTTEKIGIVGFVSSVLTPIAVALGLILSDSLTKHQEAIRLYDVYTGDIVAFAMEILAFVENAGYTTDVENASKTVLWDAQNIKNNNYIQTSMSLLEEAKLVLPVLKKWLNQRGSSANRQSMAKTVLTFSHDNNFIQGFMGEHDSPSKLSTYFNSFRVLSPNVSYKKVATMLENQIKSMTQPDLRFQRQFFLLSMERIFQTLYVLPQVTKLELRDAISTSNKFEAGRLETMDVRYCNQLKNTDKIVVNFIDSRINGPYTKIKDVQERLNGGKGLTPTQLFLQTLLDYVNELHRTVGGETQTRRTLSTAWRRLYGTYGDMATVRTYRLPRIISVTMEIALLFSSLLLPFSQIDSFVERTNAIVICIAVQVVFVGLFVGVETVRNPFIATVDAIGFANVSKAAKTTQEGVRQLWFVRGVIQQVTPLDFNFVCDESGVTSDESGDTTSVQQTQQAANVLLPNNKDQRMSYNGIHF